MSYLETGEEEQEPVKIGNKADSKEYFPAEIRELLQENLKLNQEMFAMLKGIKKYILWQQVWSILKILIIVVPIILGIIYLPAILEPYFNQYKGFFEGIGGAGALSSLIQK